MTTEMQVEVVDAPEAAEGLGLLDQIVMQSNPRAANKVMPVMI